MITIYGKQNCVYCDKAKNLLDILNRRYEYFEIDKDISKENFMKILPDAKSVPQIFIDQTYIGGYEQLVSYFRANS